MWPQVYHQSPLCRKEVELHPQNWLLIHQELRFRRRVGYFDYWQIHQPVLVLRHFLQRKLVFTKNQSNKDPKDFLSTVPESDLRRGTFSSSWLIFVMGELISRDFLCLEFFSWGVKLLRGDAKIHKGLERTRRNFKKDKAYLALKMRLAVRIKKWKNSNVYFYLFSYRHFEGLSSLRFRNHFPNFWKVNSIK